MNIDGKLIGAELRSLRNKNGYQIKEVCKNIGINQTTLYKYERNADNMKLITLKELLSFYKVNEVIFFKVISAYNHIEEE